MKSKIAATLNGVGDLNGRLCLPAVRQPKTEVCRIDAGLRGVAEAKNDAQALAAYVGHAHNLAEAISGVSTVGGSIDAPAMQRELQAAGDEVSGGDLSRLERMLASQAIVMNTMFGQFIARASKSSNLKTIEAYSRLALKAQSQCRTTAETLALMLNPTPIINQRNISNGPQQVNNGGNPARRGKKKTPNKVLDNGGANE